MPCPMLGIILRPLEDPLRKTCAPRATGRQIRRLRVNRSPCLVLALMISCARLDFPELLSCLEDLTAQINQSVRPQRSVWPAEIMMISKIAAGRDLKNTVVTVTGWQRAGKIPSSISICDQPVVKETCRYCEDCRPSRSDLWRRLSDIHCGFCGRQFRSHGYRTVYCWKDCSRFAHSIKSLFYKPVSPT